ncbi:MAG: cell division protein FtsA [bacterium]
MLSTLISKLGNSKIQSGDIAAFLDIGAAKLSCFVARIETDEDFALTAEVLATTHQASQGLSDSGLIELSADSAISSLLDKATHQADAVINKLFMAVPARHIISKRIAVDIEIDGQLVMAEDIDDCLAEASRIAAEEGYEIIHLVPVDYCLDGRAGLQDPRGLSCQTLRVIVTAVSAPKLVLENYKAALERCNFTCTGFIAAPLAAALSVLQEEEKSIGAITIDLGARSTGFSVFIKEGLMAAGHVPVGGLSITRDIALTLGVPLAEAERLKVLQGTSFCAPGDEAILIDIQDEMGKPTGETVSIMALAEIIGPRLGEIVGMTLERVEQAGIDKRLIRRAVLTGGAGQLKGACDLIERLYGIKARIGMPREVYNAPIMASHAAFAVCSGMVRDVLLYGGGMIEKYQMDRLEPSQHGHHAIAKAAHWIKTHF